MCAIAAGGQQDACGTQNRTGGSPLPPNWYSLRRDSIYGTLDVSGSSIRDLRCCRAVMALEPNVRAAEASLEDGGWPNCSGAAEFVDSVDWLCQPLQKFKCWAHIQAPKCILTQSQMSPEVTMQDRTMSTAMFSRRKAAMVGHVSRSTTPFCLCSFSGG